MSKSRKNRKSILDKKIVSEVPFKPHQYKVLRSEYKRGIKTLNQLQNYHESADVRKYVKIMSRNPQYQPEWFKITKRDIRVHGMKTAWHKLAILKRLEVAILRRLKRREERLPFLAKFETNILSKYGPYPKSLPKELAERAAKKKKKAVTEAPINLSEDFINEKRKSTTDTLYKYYCLCLKKDPNYTPSQARVTKWDRLCHKIETPFDKKKYQEDILQRAKNTLSKSDFYDHRRIEIYNRSQYKKPGQTVDEYFSILGIYMRFCRIADERYDNKIYAIPKGKPSLLIDANTPNEGFTDELRQMGLSTTFQFNEYLHRYTPLVKRNHITRSWTMMKAEFLLIKIKEEFGDESLVFKDYVYEYDLIMDLIYKTLKQLVVANVLEDKTFVDPFAIVPNNNLFNKVKGWNLMSKDLREHDLKMIARIKRERKLRDQPSYLPRIYVSSFDKEIRNITTKAQKHKYIRLLLTEDRMIDPALTGQYVSDTYRDKLLVEKMNNKFLSYIRCKRKVNPNFVPQARVSLFDIEYRGIDTHEKKHKFICELINSLNN